jgi:NAD(P)-dependent dehydrogenase (short-subunit alcohol dehydrogenase family)
MELDGRVAIVTGGAMGIGRASAECLLRYGVSLLIVDYNLEAVRKTAAELASISKSVDCLHADTSRAEDCRKSAASADERFGAVEILVNNAGIQTYGDVLTTTEEIWDQR